MSQLTPDPRQAACFHFLDCDYDPQQGIARLVYRFDDGPELVGRETLCVVNLPLAR